MKNLLIVCLLSFSLSLFGQGEGMEFYQFEKWEEVLEKAQEENKLIFMDAYAVWCGPCKMMNANVFPQEKIGEYYNAEFINVKVDMEKGEGLQLAEKYEVKAYPTFLFINGDGELVHRGLGYQETDAFLDLGQAANDPERQYGTLKERYVKGERDADLLKSYASAALQANDEQSSEAALAYLKTQDDWLTEENLAFAIDFVGQDTKDELFQHVVKNRQHFVKALGRERVDAPLKYALNMEARKEGNYTVEALQKKFEQYFPAEEAAMYTAEYKMTFYTYYDRSNPEMKKQATLEYFNKYLDQIDNWNMLNSVAWNIYETEDDKEMLANALQWALRSVELEESFFNTDTAAALYYKLGKKGKAEKMALRAIELGKEAGQDVSGSEELLDKIRKM